ncbi:hypothetical protein SDC9_174952 [bioreactor metagenome]|uniref:Uncharacterized protein n=1 Tax=bioreactor metagenome TaxID=1076179 RepID=A0A645GKR4_9ZZZZ
MRLGDDVLEHRRAVVGFGRVALEQLLRGHQHLVRRLAPAAAPAHAICNNAKHAAVEPGVRQQCNPVLLVLPISLVDPGGGCQSKGFGHGGMLFLFRYVAGRPSLIGRSP